MADKRFNAQMVHGGKENNMNVKLTWRIWVLIVALLLSLLAIHPSFQSGAVVKYVEKDSPLFKAGLRAGEIITSVNGQAVNAKTDYTNIVSKIVFDPNGTKFDIKTKSNEYIELLNTTPQITVDNTPKTKIQTGLDLRGGARALVQPRNVTLTEAEMDDLIQISRNRFNVYGLADVQISSQSDLAGNKFMLIEIAGATPGDLEELISKQGKFEAKISNKTVFTGGAEDIQDVCRNDAKCAGISSCQPSQSGYSCQFRFTLYLTPAAAERHKEFLDNLTLDESGQYLSEKLYLYVDGIEVDSLLIGASLKGQATTEISVQGPGVGTDQQEAYNDAIASMKKLQTILKTGSIPYKLDIVKLDTISPNLGDTFVYWILLAGASAIILVGIVVFGKYHRIKASLAVLFTSFSEIFIILGVAALINWNLDLPSIAGILATIGTGVDQQIVILDEAERNKELSMKEKLKRALFIIFSAFFASSVSLLPLFSAGAGFFKGFAITTLIGITAGVLITRPAFSDIIKLIEEQ
jgi:preprotein translocase subunit SecD